MSKILDFNEIEHVQREILSQCIWSETYSSLRHILKQTSDRLPLLISFTNNNNSEQQIINDNYQTILFFDRNYSNKLLLTPLQQDKNQQDQFYIYPKYCTFIITDLFKGLFEFVLNGQRCCHIFKNLDDLTAYTSNFSWSTIFMSRNRVSAYIQDQTTSKWSRKKYVEGAIFRGEHIHRGFISNDNGEQIPNDYLECYDEEGHIVFIKMNQSGRFSLIATSNEQQEYQPEIYIYSTQMPNIDQFIKRITSYNNNKNNINNCIRLVRGPVPDNFYCQYFRFIRQNIHDVLVGLTREGLIIEWNLESHVPCRYAINLNEIVANMFETTSEQILISHIDQARIYYRENFQQNLQLISNQDWTSFFQYWKWIGDTHQGNKNDNNNNTAYQNRHRFHLIASVQDLSDHSRTLMSVYKYYHKLSLLKENNSNSNKKKFSAKQRSFFSQMSNLIASPRNSRYNNSKQKNPHTSILVLQNDTKPFDDSIYDSNQIPHRLTKKNFTNRSTQKQQLHPV